MKRIKWSVDVQRIRIITPPEVFDEIVVRVGCQRRGGETSVFVSKTNI